MKKILVVDDDRTVVDLLVRVLSAEGYAVRFAYDGESAMDWIERDTFDLIISDLMMPRRHGFQLIEQVRAKQDAAHTKILVLTAKTFPRDAERAQSAGADLFLSKPFEIEHLKATISKLLS
jgi:DNA-binding response OmpR family regulator